MDGLVPLPLLGGLTAGQLWPLTNAVLPAWVLLAVAPGWSHTPSLTLLPPVLLALTYVGAIGSLLLWPSADAPAPDFASLAGVVALFRDPSGVFAGWLHYLVFDLLVGRGIVLDARERGVPHLAVVPCLLFTLMLGPTGWLMYLGARALLATDKAKNQ